MSATLRFSDIIFFWARLTVAILVTTRNETQWKSMQGRNSQIKGNDSSWGRSWNAFIFSYTDLGIDWFSHTSHTSVAFSLQWNLQNENGTTIVMWHGTYTRTFQIQKFCQVLSSLCPLCAFQSLQSVCPFSKSLVGPRLWVDSYAQGLSLWSLWLSGSSCSCSVPICEVCVLVPCLTFWIWLLGSGSLRPTW